MGLKMKKITNYILNGQGLGMKFLVALSVLISLIFAITIRVQGAYYIPYAQEIAEQMLPIKVVNGQIVEPLNTFRMAQVHIEGRNTPLALPLVLDTRVSNLDANLLHQGIYVTRTNIYTVNKNQVKVIKIEGDNYIPYGDYTDVFKNWLNWTAIICGIAGIVILFVMYFIMTMFYALCTQIVAKLARRHMSFDSRMRLSAVVLTATYILFIPLGWLGINSTLLFLAVMLSTLSWFVVKYLPTEKMPDKPNVVKDEVLREDNEPVMIKSAPIKKAPKLKASSKKKAPTESKTKKPAVPAKAEAKTSVKNSADKKKTVRRKPRTKAPKDKQVTQESK